MKCAKQHVPLKEFKQNLLDMVDYLEVNELRREKTCLRGLQPAGFPMTRLKCIT